MIFFQEVAHVVARHGAERISSQTVAIAIMIALSAAGLDWGISRVLQTYLVDLPNSRTQELEGTPTAITTVIIFISY
jgi:Zn-dependent protease with chaperone function